MTNTLAFILYLLAGPQLAWLASSRLSATAAWSTTRRRHADASAERRAPTRQFYTLTALRKDPFENGIHVPELIVQVERLLDLSRR